MAPARRLMGYLYDKIELTKSADWQVEIYGVAFMKKRAKADLLIVSISALVPTVIYLFFEPQWRVASQDPDTSFGITFFVMCVLAFCLSGLGALLVVSVLKESFASYGMVRKNAFIVILLSVLAFIPHLIFMIAANGWHGYAPMSGAIVYDGVVSRPPFQRLVCMGIVFLIWGFCEGFTYVLVSRKVNTILPAKGDFMNFGAIIGGILCVMMHGGVPLDLLSLFDALTMFIFIYVILIVKDRFRNAWGCIFSFFFLWNAFP